MTGRRKGGGGRRTLTATHSITRPTPHATRAQPPCDLTPPVRSAPAAAARQAQLGRGGGTLRRLRLHVGLRAHRAGRRAAGCRRARGAAGAARHCERAAAAAGPRGSLCGPAVERRAARRPSREAVRRRPAAARTGGAQGRFHRPAGRRKATESPARCRRPLMIGRMDRMIGCSDHRSSGARDPRGDVAALGRCAGHARHASDTLADCAIEKRVLLRGHVSCGARPL